jgi:hypothetical protein
MNNRLRLVIAALLGAAALALSACSTVQADVAKVIPPGEYKSITATVTGKFSATSFTGEDVTITPDGKMVGGHVHFRHSNVYVPLIEVDVQAATTLSPAANK